MSDSLPPQLDSTTSQQTGYDEAEIIRSMIEHENTLQNYRVTWLVTIQGLLFAALHFALDKKEQDRNTGLASLFCVLGVVVSLSGWSVLRLSNAAFRGLFEWWRDHKPLDYQGPPIVGHWENTNFKYSYLWPWRILPWLFLGSWIFVYIYAVLL